MAWLAEWWNWNLSQLEVMIVIQSCLWY
jgi:hypothetical protein